MINIGEETDVRQALPYVVAKRLAIVAVLDCNGTYLMDLGNSSEMVETSSIKPLMAVVLQLFQILFSSRLHSLCCLLV